jgi:hypothetical protein
VPKHPNWGQVSPLLPIASLSDSYDGPVVLADETQTIRWFCAKANKEAVRHVEHKRNEQGHFLFEDQTDEQRKADELGDPITEERQVEPAFWALAEII